MRASGQEAHTCHESANDPKSVHCACPSPIDDELQQCANQLSDPSDSDRNDHDDQQRASYPMGVMMNGQLSGSGRQCADRLTPA